MREAMKAVASERQETTMTEAEFSGPLEVGMPYVKKRRSLPKKIALWFKGFFKLYRLPDQAAETESRYWDHTHKLQALDQKLTQQFVSIETQKQALDQKLTQQFVSIETQLRALVQKIAALESDSNVLESRTDVLELRFDDLEPRFEDKLLAFKKDRNDESQRLAEQIGGLRREIMFQQRRLTQIVLPAPAGARAAAVERVANERLDSFYAAFDDVFRGSGEDIKERLARYVDILRDAGAGHLGKPVLDIGCGRGEWLELLKEKNIPAYGVDINSVMVERTAVLDLDVRNADAIEHLKGLPDGAVSALTAFHIVEHLPFEVLIDFLDEALRVLAPGGVAIFETPNPETIRVGATTFYFDPTHRNPIPPQTLQFMVAHRGFQNAEILRLHPFTDGLLTQPTADAERLDLVLLGSQDYAVIARRL